MADNRPGVARGEFRVDTSQLRATGQIIAQLSRAMVSGFQQASTAIDTFSTRATSGVNRVANAFRQAEARRKAFESSDLGTIQKGLQNIATSLGGIVSTLGGAGVVKAGIDASVRVQRLGFLMETFSGSTELANQRMADLRDIADRTGQSFVDVAEGAAAILPAVARNNVDLGKTLSLVQRLAILDPAQGIEGAAFAIRELLGGDTKSLAGRFELPRKQLAAILEEAGGDPQKIIDGLDGIVTGIGLTQERFEEMGRSGANAFGRLRGTITEALATAFTPLVNNFLIPGATKIADFISQLNQTNPALLQTASIFAVAAAGAAPLLLVLSQLITAYKTLKEVSNTGIGRGVGRAAGAGIAGALGLGVGLEAVKGLANAGVRSGDLGRVAGGEDPGAILAERLKQILVILVDGLFENGRNVVLGVAQLVKIVNQLGNVLQVAQSILQEGFGNLEQTLGRAVIAIADLFAGLFDTTQLRESGLNTESLGRQRVADAQAAREQAQGRLGGGIGLTPEEINGVLTQFNDLRSNVIGGLTNFLFPVEQATDSVVELGEAAAEAADATNNSAAAFEQHEEAIRETAKKISDLNQDFAEESARINQQRAIDAQRDKFDFNLRRGREDRDNAKNSGRQDADFFASRQRQVAQHNAELGRLEADARQQQLKNLEEFRREDVRRAEDHGRRLAEIERDTKAAVEDAASQLDARGVLRAFEAGNRQVEDTNSNFNRETQQRQEEFNRQQADLVANLQAQRTEQQTAYEQRLIDDLTQYQLQRTRQQEDFALRRADEDEDRLLRQKRQEEDFARQDNARRIAHQRQINEMIAALAAETGIQQQMLNVVVQGMAAAGGAVANFVNYVNQKLAQLGQGTTFTAPTGTSNSGGIISPGPTPTQFGFGGIPPRNRPVEVNDRGFESGMINNRMFAMFSQPAKIFNAQQTQQILGGAGGGFNFTGTFAPVFGDIGNRSNGDVTQLVKQALTEWLGEMEAIKGRKS